MILIVKEQAERSTIGAPVRGFYGAFVEINTDTLYNRPERFICMAETAINVQPPS